MTLFWFLLLLTLLSLPITYAYPLYWLEKEFFYNDVSNIKDAEVIVILGGGLTNSSSMMRPNLTLTLLERVRFGAFLQRKSELPILVSGAGFHYQFSEAKIMKQVLEKEFHAEVTFVEDKSSNTQENAKFSSEILKQNGIKSILLVSNSWHLKRASLLFKRYAKEIEVIPIADFLYANQKFTTGWYDFVPSMATFYYQRRIYRECFAYFKYRYFE